MTSTSINADRLLVLDDTDEIAELIGELAERAGYSATVATDIDTFNAALEHEPPSVIVLDLQMPEVDGVEVLRQLAALGCQARILLVTGMDRQTVASARRFGRQMGLNVLGVVQKPFEPEVLVRTLSKARSLVGQLSPDDLETAIHDASLNLRYQPVVRRLGPQCWHAESVEALPRWQHAEFGTLTPGQFLPLISSERSTLMRLLADYVLEHGAQQLQAWQSTGLHLGLRVNIPGGLIADTDFPDRLEHLLNELDADPVLLTLELSDVSALTHSRDGIEILTRLRLKGINLSLDDFGTGNTAFQPLYTLPFNEVKIDKVLTGDLTGEPGAQTVFSAISDLLRELDISCCAEGVESAEQLDILDRLECDLLQGFYIGTPLPASEIPKAVEAWTVDPARRITAGTG